MPQKTRAQNPESELALHAHAFRLLFTDLIQPDIPVYYRKAAQLALALAAQRQNCAALEALNMLKELTKDEKSQLLKTCQNFTLELMDLL